MTTPPLATDFAATSLYRSAFEHPEGEESASPAGRARRAYEVAFLQLRERALLLAEQIQITLPTFTVHGPSHLDALWEVGSRVAGVGISLTPPEGYVLGGAFMLHDLGMALAAYPNSEAELQEGAEWGDALATTLRQRLGRFPTAAEIASADHISKQLAMSMLIRNRHSQRAEELAFVEWPQGTTRYHLIDNTDFRENFGIAIGRVAASHWWPLDRVVRTFRGVQGAPAWLAGSSADWTIDLLKIACLVRTADACHLDALRGPGFIMALRRPGGDAMEHWDFQSRMTKPQIVNHRFVFSATRPFTEAEDGSWWQAYEALRVADEELRGVDHMFGQERRGYSFVVRGVAGAESPERLAQYIETDGWEPADTRLRATNVARVVQHLGGRELYGPDPTVPMRELIQNAADAIRARRIVDRLPASAGKITVRIGRSTVDWIEVEDNGIGMSSSVLSGPLLDLGASYWGSALMQREWPGVLASGFLPTGRFGIGFFSCFMWGDTVTVASCPCLDTPRDTRILEFQGGTGRRPLLRTARDHEMVRHGGTRVRVQLRPGTLDALVQRPGAPRAWTIPELLGWLCPTLDTNLELEDGAAVVPVIAADDWKTITGEALLTRLWGPTFLADPDVAQDLVTHAPFLRELADAEGNATGRLTFAYLSQQSQRDLGVVTVGGLRATETSRFAGVVAGEPERASRDLASPTFVAEALASWASIQGQIVAPTVTEELKRSDLAAHVRSAGGETGLLPIARGVSGWIAMPHLAAWADVPETVYLVMDYTLAASPVTFESDTLVVPHSSPFARSGPRLPWTESLPARRELSTQPWWRENLHTLSGAVIEGLAARWTVSVDAVLEASILDTNGIACSGRPELQAYADARVCVIRRPVM